MGYKFPVKFNNLVQRNVDVASVILQVKTDCGTRP